VRASVRPSAVSFTKQNEKIAMFSVCPLFSPGFVLSFRHGERTKLRTLLGRL